jgi:AdoMet-dependent heme synthase
MYTTLSAPILVQWEVTPVCNHNCIHCYNYWRKVQPTRKLMSGYKPLYEKIVSELVNSKVYAVIITGGEPLTVIDNISEYIKKLSDNRIWVTMNSNLTLLTPKKARILKECGIKSILVSLPSGNSETNDNITNVKGSLKRIVKGIRLAKEFGFPIYTNMVVSKANKDQIRETAQLVASLGLKNFAATRASDPSSNSGFSDQLLTKAEFLQMQQDLEQAGKEFNLTVNSLEANPVCSYSDIVPIQGYKFCTAGKTTCTVSFEGNIRPCNRSIMEYGNISDGLSQAWLKMSDWRSDIWIPDECSECKVKFRCMGGCKADAMSAYGNPKKPDPLCDISFSPKDRSGNKLGLTNKTQFKVNPRLKVRQEPFGGILFVSTSTWVPVDIRLFELFSQRKEVVLLEDIANAFNTEIGKAVSTATYLLNKQILL